MVSSEIYSSSIGLQPILLYISTLMFLFNLLDLFNSIYIIYRINHKEKDFRDDCTLCMVNVLPYTIKNSVLLEFSICFAFVRKRRQYLFEFFIFCTQIIFVFRFGHHAKDLAAMPQVWPPCHRFGRQVTDLTALPQIWTTCHRFGSCAIDVAAVLQIWPPFHRFGHAKDLAAMPQVWPPCHRFGHQVTNLTAVPQIWPPCHRFVRTATGLA